MYKTFIASKEKPKVSIPGKNADVARQARQRIQSSRLLEFTQPRSLSNQGDDIDFVRHPPLIVLPVPEDVQD